MALLPQILPSIDSNRHQRRSPMPPLTTTTPCNHLVSLPAILQWQPHPAPPPCQSTHIVSSAPSHWYSPAAHGTVAAASFSTPLDLRQYSQHRLCHHYCNSIQTISPHAFIHSHASTISHCQIWCSHFPRSYPHTDKEGHRCRRREKRGVLSVAKG
jgi:hypothetical protein